MRDQKVCGSRGDGCSLEAAWAAVRENRYMRHQGSVLRGEDVVNLRGKQPKM